MTEVKVPVEVDHRFDSTVVSFVPFEIVESKPGLIPGHFRIKASDMVKPSVIHVGISGHYVYLDETRGSLRVNTSSIEVARSIVEDWINSQLAVDSDRYPAIFYLAGFYKADEVARDFAPQCLAAKVRQNKWFLELAKIADTDWNRYHQHNVISDFQRLAARHIGWQITEHPWMSADAVTIENARATRCPFCGSQTDGFPRCPNCKEILDQKRFDEAKQAKELVNK